MATRADGTTTAAAPRRRGRRPTVTPTLIAEAGAELGLDGLTITAVAAALGVTPVTIHNHIDGIAALRRLVAETIVDRYPSLDIAGDDLVADLLTLSHQLRRFVHAYPGIGQYLAHIDASSRRWLARIDAEHGRFVDAYGLSPTQASWLVSTVAEHAIALAEIVYTRTGRPPRRDVAALAARPELTTLPKVRRVDRDDTWFFEWSMTATINGAIGLIADLD